ncbi:MAG: META domain-containing protein [Planctomycetes bacterium]|nr:META domain-containing protein [Planctomycetota bacterium]
MKLLILSLTVVVTLVMAACQSAPTGGMKNPLDALIGSWTLDSLNGKSFAQLVPADAPANKPTMDIGQDGKVSGFAGVNRWMSSLDVASLAKGDFKLSPAGSTMMAGPEYAMKLEREFLDALQKARNFKLDGSKLTLTDGANQIMQLVKGS